MKLEVPVGVFLTDNNKLLVKGNGKSELVNFPVKPFYFSQSRTGELARLIGSSKEINIAKNEFERMPFKEAPSMRSEIPSFDFLTNMFREHPEAVQDLAKGGMDIYPQFMDIETYGSTGNNFNPEVAICLTIQVKYPDTLPILLVYRHPGTEGIVYNDPKVAEIIWYDTEEEMLRAYIDITKVSPTGKVPDCIVGYRHSVFDIMFVEKRMEILGIKKYKHTLAYYQKSDKGTKVNGGIYYTFGMKSEAKNGYIHLYPGYILFDLYYQVKRDMNKKIKSLPSKSLKNVAHVYGSKDVYDIDTKSKTNMLELITTDPETYFKYSISDVLQTEYLYNIYVTRLIAMSNLIKVPFLTTLFYSSGQISTTALYRDCRENKFFSFDTNLDRYPKLCEFGKYEGATVECLQTGYFQNVIYLDAKSMYPTIMEDFNCSYEKYIYHGHTDFDKWREQHKGTDYEDPTIIRSSGPQHARKVFIPDNKYNAVLEFTFDFSEPGFIKKMIMKYNSIRYDYKSKMTEARNKFEETGDKNYELQANTWDARQQAAKVISNTFYGIQGNMYLKFADLPIAVFITAMGRWLMAQISELAGDSILEKDTDGIVVDLDRFPYTDIEEFTMKIRKKMVDLFNLNMETIKFDMEFEGKGSLYLYAMKNYILRTEKDNKLTIKGVAFTGYNKTKLFHRAVKLISHAVMYGEYEGRKITYDQACKEAMYFKKLPMEYFMKTQNVRKSIEDYKSSENVTNYSYNFEIQPEGNRQKLVMLKKRACDWITSNKEIDKNINVKFKKLIRRCKTEVAFVAQCNDIMEKLNLKRHSENFFVQLIKRKKELGYEVNIDDEIAFYLTYSKTGYSLEEETTFEMLNMEKYYEIVHEVIKSFSLINNKEESLDKIDIGGLV